MSRAIQLHGGDFRHGHGGANLANVGLEYVEMETNELGKGE